MKRLAALCFLFLAVSLPAAEGSKLIPKFVEFRRIWDQAEHNGFTDITYFKEKWYCVFRSGSAHVSTDGFIQVLSTVNGHGWESAARLKMNGFDLRDPKLSIVPGGDRLMISAAAAVREESKAADGTLSISAFSKNGTKWDDISVVGPENYWLWRVTWQDDTAWGVAYDVSPESRENGSYDSMLLKSTDGREFEVAVPQLLAGNESRPTEATIRFGKDGTAYCLHRRDGKIETAMLGSSKAPYEEWSWLDLGMYFGGPNFIQIPTGEWIACGRMRNVGKERRNRTVICELDVKTGKLIPLSSLPSDGDNSYPGLLWHDDVLWITYYSSHEGKASIYLGKIKFERKPDPEPDAEPKPATAVETEKKPEEATGTISEK